MDQIDIKESKLVKIIEIFQSELPKIPRDLITEFANSMIEYHKSWKRSRKVGIHYNKDPNYLSYCHVVFVTKSDDYYWVYSPGFVRVIVKTINMMFNTNIKECSSVPPHRDTRYLIFSTNVHEKSYTDDNLWFVRFDKIHNGYDKVMVSLNFPMTTLEDLSKEHSQCTAWNAI